MQQILLLHKMEYETDRQIEHMAKHPRVFHESPEGWKITEETATNLKNKINQKAQENQLKNEEQAIIFDLDGTLFDPSHRTYGILKRWMQDKTVLPQPLEHSLRSLKIHQVGYSILDTLDNIGMKEFRESLYYQELERVWGQGFFDGLTLLEFDEMIEGAAHFVNQLSQYQIIYLTGRLQSAMEWSTWKQLKKFNFPTENTRLIMKPERKMDDHLYKEDAFKNIMKEFKVIGNFENEYINLYTMAKLEPQGIHVVVDTLHSGRYVDVLDTEIYKIKNFS